MDKVEEKYHKLLEYAPEEENDSYAKKELKKRLYKWRNDDRKYLVDLEYFVNGEGYTSLLDALYEEDELEKMEIKFLSPDLDAEWGMSTPTKVIREKGGKGVCKVFDVDPMSLNKWSNADKPEAEKVMVRGFFNDFYVPMSIQTKSEYHHAEEIPRQYQPRLKKLDELWRDVKDGVLPLQMRLCLYPQEGRYPYLIDIISDKQLTHPLSHMTSHLNEKREPIEYMHFDKVLAIIDLPQVMKNILELLFEGGELTSADIAHAFNMNDSIAQNNLDSLESKGLVVKRKEMYYKISMSRIKELAEELD